jgi:phage-related minor tail protein
MDFMDNISRWEDALKDFVRSIKQMIQRAIAEWIYENFIKQGVESLLGGILGKAQGGGKKPNFGQMIGGVLLSGLIGWGLGQIFPGFFQHGGTAVAGRLAVVGERGPEIIVPGMTSAVVPAEAVARALARIENGAMMPQMNIYVNHDGDLGLAQRIGREVERRLRRWRY